MPDGLIDRIVASTGIENLVDILASDLAPTDLQSLMLEVYRRRAAAVAPADLLRRFETDRFCPPSPVDPVAVTRFETRAWSLLPDSFEAVELSPVAPLGTSSAMATVDQHKVVSTSRNTEVVSDSTGVLALEAARRRRADRRRPVHLAASQRQLRAQKFDGAGAAAHFRLLCLVSSGRSAAFEREAVATHIGYLTRLLTARDPVVSITDLSGRWSSPPDGAGAEVRMDPARQSGRGYYREMCFKIHAGGMEVGDGGCVDWTGQLLSDAKERTVISCIAIERLVGSRNSPSPANDPTE